MAFPNRELSQFGSFLLIDDSGNTIGIATTATPNIGIGTTSSNVKLTVIGDTNLKGNLTVSNGTIEADSYTLNGNPLVNATIAYWNQASNETDIYRLQGNVGIGTSIISEKLTVDGNVSASQFISTVTSGTAPFVVLSDTQVTNLNASYLRGKVPPSGNIVGDSDTQTLSNKTLSSPILINPILGSAGIAISGSISGSTTLKAYPVASGIVTVPSTNDILVARDTTDTLTNKTIAASSNTITGLTNSNLSGSAGISNANLANSTISGVSLGSTLSSLTFGSYLSSSGVYNGSTSRTVSVAATSVNTANTVVARDNSGDFTAGSVTATNFYGNGSNLTGIGRLIRGPQMLTSGTSYTTPSNCTRIYVECVGGGGGGSYAFTGAGGGGGGGYAAKYFTVTPSTTYTYSIGQGGSAGVSGSGGVGGTTSFIVSIGSSISANGGTGGGPGNNGGSGGSGVDGDINLKGNGGGYGLEVSSYYYGGHGGGSVYGGGAHSPGNGNGIAGSNGGGGSGGSGSGANTGGAGGNGLIIIWEYS